MNWNGWRTFLLFVGMTLSGFLLLEVMKQNAVFETAKSLQQTIFTCWSNFSSQQPVLAKPSTVKLLILAYARLANNVFTILLNN